MAKESRNSIAVQLVIDMERRIRHKFFDPEEQLPSLKTVCRIHQISYMTAYRIYDELARRGIIYSINGKGYFINRDHVWNDLQSSIPPLEEIVTFVADETEENSSLLIKGIREEARSVNIPLRILKNSADFKISESSGIIFRYGESFMRLYQKLEFRRLRVILTNNYFPTLHSIIHDNFDAMKNIFDRVEEYGCKSALLCSGLFTDLGQANLNEREYAFSWECQRRAIKPTLLLSGDINELASILHDPLNSPDALIFGTCVTAANFAELRKINIKKKIKYFVFNTAPEPIEGIDSWLFSGENLGRAAVRMLIENSPEAWMLSNVTRVKGSWG